MLAYTDHAFDLLNFVLVLVAFVAVHAASNLMKEGMILKILRGEDIVFTASRMAF